MSLEELPELLTVEEAAGVLRIGRTLAYELARQWEATDGRDGLPVMRLGRVLRVPRRQLQRLIDGDLTTGPLPVVPEAVRTRPRTRTHHRPSMQLGLLDQPDAS